MLISTLHRFFSHRQPLDHAFLRDRLRHAKSYKRIAGYFRSSIFELVGEEIAAIPDVRIFCNRSHPSPPVQTRRLTGETRLKPVGSSRRTIPAG